MRREMIYMINHVALDVVIYVAFEVKIGDWCDN